MIEKFCKVTKLELSSVVNEEINVNFKNNVLRDVYIKMKRFKFDLLFTLSIALSDLEKKKLPEIISLYVSGDKSLLTNLFPKASLLMAQNCLERFCRLLF